MTPPKPPTAATLQKYGLTAEAWLLLAGDQCFICEQSWDTVDPVVDHKHVAGWRKLPPEERKKWVRGVISRNCNFKFVPRGMTARRARRVSEYLARFEKRAG